MAARGGEQGQGIQLSGTRPFTFKSIFGTVEVARTRITNRANGAIQTPSATALGTAHRCELTRSLLQAICDRMLDESAGAPRQDVGKVAGEPDLVGWPTVLEVVHEEGVALLGAVCAPAEETLKAPERRTVAVAEVSCPPVILELDEVKVKAQPCTGRKEVWLFTAVIRLEGCSHLLVASAQEELTRQLAA